MALQNSKLTKWYIYISTAKLDMLYQQLASASEKAVKKLEWKIDLKVAAVSRSSTRETGASNKSEQLREIMAAIEESEDVGTVDEPKSFFKGTLPMRWGIYADIGRPEAEPPLVYFGGKTDRSIFGLGGSSRHVIGMEGSTSTNSRSATPYLVHHLLQGLDLPESGWHSYPSWDNDEQHTFEAIALATHQLKPPTQNLEFFAKTLLMGKIRHDIITQGEKRQVVLGTPLYVSYGDPWPDTNPWKQSWI